MDWLNSTAVCESAIPWYQMFIFMGIFGAAIVVMMKIAAQAGWREGADWASREMGKIIDDEELHKDREKQRKVIDFVMEKEARAQRILH